MFTTTSSASTATPALGKQPRQGISSPAKRKARLPYKIGLALASIDTDPALRELPLTARNVLRFIVQVTDARDPLKASWPHKKTIAEYLNIGEATVYRNLNILIENNLIERLEQERKAWNGRFAGSRMRLTRRCCLLLGLLEDVNSGNEIDCENNNFIEESRNTKENENIGNNIHAKTRAVCVAASPRDLGATGPVDPSNGGLQEAGLSTDPAIAVIDGYINTQPTAVQPTQSEKQSRPPVHHRPTQGKPVVKVPSEFFWLIDEGRLTGPAVCKLMRMFSTRGQKLSNAVNHTRKRLEEIPKAKTYAYLARLAMSGTNFAWLAEEREREVHAARKAAKVKKQTASLQGMAGQYLLSQDRSRVILLAENHADVWWQQDGRTQYGVASFSDLADAYANGRLIPVEQQEADSLLAQWGMLN